MKGPLGTGLDFEGQTGGAARTGEDDAGKSKREAAADNRHTAAGGERRVAICGSADRATITTGDNNKIS